MDSKTEQYIDDVLKALGQMEHHRGLDGKMLLSIKTRQELINRGSDLIGLWNIPDYYGSTIRADAGPIDQQSAAGSVSETAKGMNENEKFLSLVALFCFIMFSCVGDVDAAAYFMSGIFCLYGLIWGRTIKEPRFPPRKKIPITDVINQISM